MYIYTYLFRKLSYTEICTCRYTRVYWYLTVMTIEKRTTRSLFHYNRRIKALILVSAVSPDGPRALLIMPVGQRIYIYLILAARRHVLPLTRGPRGSPG